MAWLGTQNGGKDFDQAQLPFVKRAHDGGAFDSDEEYPLPLQLEYHLPPAQRRMQSTETQGAAGATAERHCKSKRDKLLRDVVVNCWGEPLHVTEARVGATFEELKNRGLIMIAKDKDDCDEFIAVPFVGSPKDHNSIKEICDEPDVYTNIRHGGPWSEIDGLLERKNAEYLAGLRKFLEHGWKYCPETPNLTLAWLIYTKSSATPTLVGRGGLQVEDETPSRPRMTEPFIAIKDKKRFWNRGIASMFFRQHLIPFYDRVSGDAPIRILGMPTNAASRKIADSRQTVHTSS